jgi:hypothetical protein
LKAQFFNELLEETVKVQRKGNARSRIAERWWQYEHYRRELYEAISGLDRVMAISRITHYPVFAFLEKGIIYSEKLIVFPNSRYGFFALLQSRVHEVWAIFFSSTMKDDLQYTPTDCFETFPFPKDYDTLPALEQVGRDYYEYRAALMVRNNQGLTAIYNRLNDPEERDPGIGKLRALHATMDRIVLDAYGWTDIQPTCEFILDYEDDEDAETNRPRRRKKPWRYRWPDEIRDEVLARLLELNRVRAEEEQLSGAAAEADSKSRANRQPRMGKKNMAIGTGSLLDSLPEEGQS